MKAPEEYLFTNGISVGYFNKWWRYAKLNTLKGIKQAQIDAYKEGYDQALSDIIEHDKSELEGQKLC